MASFNCPECGAWVVKKADDPLGCPCCGYKKEVSLRTSITITPYEGTLPYVGDPLPYHISPWYPISPWYITSDTLTWTSNDINITAMN